MRIAWLMLPLLCAAVWASDAQLEYGRELFLTSGGYGCAVCHGPVADGAGQAGGYIRGASLESLQQSLQQVAPMQPLASLFSEQDVNALAAYLSSLAQTPLLSLTFSEGSWQVQYERWQAGDVVDVVVFNNSFESLPVNLSPLGIEPFQLAPLERQAKTGQVTDLAQNLAHLKARFSLLE
ncbi:c-type cytochrome [Reinekea marinisedimentorum]|uniref:Cytochrome c553 n=1 Tax=Reinekea marinisedimentorum TaxID=230495 RepID=A0A4R3HY29_9GAMM|nr:hypothetical protein [Reinekea marinisedimentorum]TCS37125.1 cytochrome c553 [Reinekea marinisedimentorum]